MAPVTSSAAPRTRSGNPTPRGATATRAKFWPTLPAGPSAGSVIAPKAAATATVDQTTPEVPATAGAPAAARVVPPRGTRLPAEGRPRRNREQDDGRQRPAPGKVVLGGD